MKSCSDKWCVSYSLFFIVTRSHKEVEGRNKLSVFVALCYNITNTEDTFLESTQEGEHGTALLQKEMRWIEPFSKYHLLWPLYKTGVSRTEWIRSNLPPCPAIPVPCAYTNILALLKTTPNSSYCSQPVIWKQGLPSWCFRKTIVVV